MIKEIGKSLLIGLWFIFLTFPLVGVRVDPYEDLLEWRWMNVLYVGIGSFILSFFWRYFLEKTKQKKKKTFEISSLFKQIRTPAYNKAFMGLLVAALLAFPFSSSSYQVTIVMTALIYVVLGLGLNIVVGLAGLLDLGYVAFYAVGAYSYALINYHFQLGFWAILPVAGILAGLFGVILGIPVLRLRGDYLAIVTLGFGEIIRIVLENWNEFSFGPSGIANIPKPGFFGLEMDHKSQTIYLYFLVLIMVVFTVIAVQRLKVSRIGRAWVALREDEIACEAMGIDTTKTKLTAFGMGACWAGFMGAFFAAKNGFINPASFSFHQSAIILCVVVFGGMGSITGVIIAALILTLLPEYLRAFADYRMLLFGALMILMMVFRPRGLVSETRQRYPIPEKYRNQEEPPQNTSS